jgi:hypothetical protein
MQHFFVAMLRRGITVCSKRDVMDAQKEVQNSCAEGVTCVSGNAIIKA